MVHVGDWADTRLKHLSKNDTTRDESRSGSSFGKKVANWVGREMVYPTNVLHLATECSNKKHSASFPKGLPEFFVKLFTAKGDLVLDPFEGSGTTGEAAIELKRNYIGIELNDDYHQTAEENLLAASKTRRLPTFTPAGDPQ